MDKVIWIDNGKKTAATHDILMKENELYNKLFNDQRTVDNNEIS